MKFLLDQGLPRSAAQILREKGYDVLHVAEISLASAADLEILTVAFTEQRVVITIDADFHAIMMLSQSKTPSVIRLRIEGLKGVQLAEIIIGLLESVSTELDLGALVTVTSRSIRIHRL